MNITYDEQLEVIWHNGSTSAPTTFQERRNAVLEKFPCKDRKCERVFIAPSGERRFACICSRMLNRYFVVIDEKGNSFRVGKECIEKILKDKELREAQKLMEVKELEVKEKSKIKTRKIAQIDLI